LQLKKVINIVFVFKGWAKGFFVAGEFVPLHSVPCLFVCGLYRPARMEGQNASFFPAASKRSTKTAQ
jgi:hypothetical protein